eukprot:1159250-Pelagomonas_calceolata.AAC.5
MHGGEMNVGFAPCMLAFTHLFHSRPEGLIETNESKATAAISIVLSFPCELRARCLHRLCHTKWARVALGASLHDCPLTELLKHKHAAH